MRFDPKWKPVFQLEKSTKHQTENNQNQESKNNVSKTENKTKLIDKEIGRHEAQTSRLRTSVESSSFDNMRTLGFHPLALD